MPTIVLIPGLMNDGWVWQPQMPRLSRLAPVFVACNDGCDTLAAMAARIADATTGPLFVVGHSMGGRVALELVATSPDRVGRLALLSTGAHGKREAEVVGRMKLVALARDNGMAAVADAWLPDMMGANADAEARAGVRAMLCRANPAVFAAQQQALLNRPDRTPLLSTIACPTLIATGEQDGWASPAQHAALAEAIPGARLEVIPGAGHMLPVEAPKTLAELLVSFLSGEAA